MTLWLTGWKNHPEAWGSCLETKAYSRSEIPKWDEFEPARISWTNKWANKMNKISPSFCTHKLVTSSPWRPSAPWRFCFRPISGQAVDDRRYVSDLFRRMRCAVICFTISQIPNSRTNPLPSADSPCLSQARPRTGISTHTHLQFPFFAYYWDFVGVFECYSNA